MFSLTSAARSTRIVEYDVSEVDVLFGQLSHQVKPFRPFSKGNLDVVQGFEVSPTDVLAINLHAYMY